MIVKLIKILNNRIMNAMYVIILFTFNVIVCGRDLNTDQSAMNTSECNNSTYNYDSKEEHHIRTDKAISNKSRHFPDAVQLPRERKKQKDMFQRLLPMFIIPYLVQSALLPMILMAMKAMLVKSLLIGKLALILVAINAFRSRINAAQSHESTNLVHEHYGFNGNEEFGAYVNSGH